MAIYESIEGEIWYPIPGLPGYEISSEWRVRSFLVRGRCAGGSYRGVTTRPRILSIYKLPIGYLAFRTRIDGKARTIYLHHVIAELAYGVRPDGLGILHRDDDKMNNFPSNLVFGTQAENLADARRNGRLRLGEAVRSAKLSRDSISEIRRLAGEGYGPRHLGRLFGVTHSAIIGVLKGRTWGHVP